ncbi:hypothetical protein AC1031_012349 [Aphanomyces cochlioides]|nr:hypothetical protein AC1031_012349 [Aphanomyces cochlioides]
MEMNQSGVRMRELGQPDGASIASDELHDSIAGNSPLQPTVALDAVGSKPAVLVGSMAPLAGGGRSALLEIPPSAPIQEGDGTIIHQQPIKTNVTNDDNQLSEPNGNTEQPKRQVIDLSEPSASFAGAPKEKLSREMLATLMQLAEDESTTDDTMFSAIEQALPYPKRMGAATFWIETGNNLTSESNDKIIKSLFNDNKEATWSPLMSEFVQINKARVGDVVVTVTDETTRLGMLGQSVVILGQEYKVSAPTPKQGRPTNQRQQTELQDLYYMDVVGTRYNFDAHALLKALRRLKTNPVFISYKMTYSSKVHNSTVHPNIWRVYFNKASQPAALLINEHPVDQIILQGVTYGVFVKDYIKPTTTRQSRLSSYCIDLDKLLAQPAESMESDGNKRARVGSEEQEKHTGDQVSDPSPQQNEHTQTTAEAFQTLVTEMDVDEFIQPKKPLKRSREDASTQGKKPSWITPNMFEALSTLTVAPRVVALQKDVTVCSYIVDMQIPSPTTFHGRTSIRRMRVRHNRMQWHPNNMTMKEIVKELESLSDSLDDTRKSQELEAASVKPLEDITAF